MLKKVTLKDLDLIDSIEKTCFPSQEAASKDSLKGRLEVYPEGFYLYYVDETPIGYIGGLKNNQCELPDEMYENASLHHPNGDYQLIFSVCILPDYRHKGYARKMVKEYVSLKETIRGFKGILDGEYDHIPEQAFYMVGTIDEALEKAKNM